MKLVGVNHIGFVLHSTDMDVNYYYCCCCC